VIDFRVHRIRVEPAQTEYPKWQKCLSWAVWNVLYNDFFCDFLSRLGDESADRRSSHWLPNTSTFVRLCQIIVHNVVTVPRGGPIHHVVRLWCTPRDLSLAKRSCRFVGNLYIFVLLFLWRWPLLTRRNRSTSRSSRGTFLGTPWEAEKVTLLLDKHIHICPIFMHRDWHRPIYTKVFPQTYVSITMSICLCSSPLLCT